MHSLFIQYIVLIVAILFLVMLSEKIRIAYPIVLVIGGLIISKFGWITGIHIDPEMILVIFLPPLLYEAAWLTSWKQFWRFRRIISSFAFLIVIVTSFVIAYVSSWLIPGFTLALGFLLGAIVSPPDAVSATTILKNIKVPKSLSAIIEGESLMNDASSLIVLRFALVAVDTGRFVFHEAAFDFVLVIVMGIVVGVAVGLIYYAVHRWLPTNPNVDIALTLTAPYLMYIVAETFHFSGVLAVVSGGLFLSAKRDLILTHRSRLQGSNVWSTLGFILNGLIFMMIGLELPIIVNGLGNVSLVTAIKYGLIISFVLIVTRLICTFGASAFTIFASKYIKTATPNPGWRAPLLFGWAGMRGVVSLAAALSIPLLLSNGQAFPERNLILFITFMVILVTLVFQGLTLPILVRTVKMEDMNESVTGDELQLQIRSELAKESILFLDKQYADVLQNNVSLQRLKEKFEQDKLLPDVAIEAEHEQFRKIYLKLLKVQRACLDEINKRPETDEDIIKNYRELLDLEQEKMRHKFEVEEE